MNRSLLHDACERMDYRAIRSLLRSNANPDAQDLDGNTPLHLIPRLSLEIVQAFVDSFADFSIKNNQGISVEQYLCYKLKSSSGER
jgi:ankyrin repeat protein